MKKSAEILGLPVISILEGKELGTVKDLVVDASGGAVAALIVDDGKWYLGAKLLPFGAITGLGEYAITVDSSEYILSVVKSPELEQLLIENVKVIGTKVLTKTGRIQGTVSEIVIDDTGKIAACEISENNGAISNVPAQRIVTFGKSVLIITDEDQPTHIAAAMAKTMEKHDIPVVNERLAVQTTPTSAVAVQSGKETDDDPTRKFDEKHRKFLLGKKASRRIETDNGMIIVDQGGEITEEVLQKAKLAGKFVELSMSVQ
ncbi:PRC-barrel domain protein [Thermosinus carboxydivorans Nor1]|uniref:PRC-barrel domain protein n=1 Tax=Thermosinus carboxydivorans Nor1 TaxID=401526 RepID=A1HMT8_9FIRM|nr:PRC-barrel domain-containing protein [Thermosinus carboxydivorans]EAX48572.1 PRC-barrel domain protein [Thermosinus carboxydivorans Nor1]